MLNLMKNFAVLACVAASFSACEAPQRDTSASATAKSPASATKPSAPADAVWVGKSDDAKSCAPEKGIAVEKMDLELKTAGIPVFEQRKLHDHRMRIQMCGADKGDMNGFLISKEDLEKAQAMGFKAVPPPPRD